MRRLEFYKKDWNTANLTEKMYGEKVTLPHTWYVDDEYYQGQAIYQKVFDYCVSDDERIFVKFYGVDKVCKVYLNGSEIGTHSGGYTAFAVELTNEIKSGENILTVLVDNEKGKTVSPLSGDFAVFGGIHRKVEFITTQNTCFDRTYYGTDGFVVQTKMVDGKGIVSIIAKMLGTPEKIRITLLNENRKEVAKKEIDEVNELTEILELNNPVLWNGMDDTYLYICRAEVLSKDGNVLDTIEKSCGFRSISIDTDRGFFLNNKHLKLHGVAKHQDREGVFSAATTKDFEEDMELIREIGANAVRLSHYPHPEEIYDLSDKYGFIIWSEIPLLKLTMNEELFENIKNQLTEMILQNMHHPSIAFWGIQNEIAIFGEKPYMTEKLETLNEMVHQLDGTRFSTSANLNSVKCESDLNRITDVIAYNIYCGWYYGTFEDTGKFLDEFHRINPEKPLGISEYGADTNIAFHSEEPKVNDYSEEFQALYHEKVYPMMLSRDFVWGSFVWNMFDFTSPIRNAANIKNRNIKGLVTFDRKTRKDSFYYYKAMWSKQPFLHIASKRFVNRATDVIDVKVYTNQEFVELYCGDCTQKRNTKNGNAVFEKVPLQMGQNKIEVKSGKYRDSAVFVRVEEPDQSYVYVDQNPGLNVKNWYLDEQEEEKLFPEGFLSIRSTIGEIKASKDAMNVFEKLMPDVAESISDEDAITTFSIEQMFQFTKPDYTEDDIKRLNNELTKIAIL